MKRAEQSIEIGWGLYERRSRWDNPYYGQRARQQAEVLALTESHVFYRVTRREVDSNGFVTQTDRGPIRCLRSRFDARFRMLCPLPTPASQPTIHYRLCPKVGA